MLIHIYKILSITQTKYKKMEDRKWKKEEWRKEERKEEETKISKKGQERD
jgi:hypothetical protein